MARPVVTAEQFLPPPTRRSLRQLASAAVQCRGCELYANATHVVFGKGPSRARLVLIGEQPGDQEDRAGAPFVGPSGQVLDRALIEADIARADVYLTNAVKHFHFVERGKRRLHQKPMIRHVRSCAPWLRCELEAIRPAVIVALGATAAQSLLGASFRVTQQRGRPVKNHDWPGGPIVSSVHPSAILRMRSSEERETAFNHFVQDLKVAAGLL